MCKRKIGNIVTYSGGQNGSQSGVLETPHILYTRLLVAATLEINK